MLHNDAPLSLCGEETQEERKQEDTSETLDRTGTSEERRDKSGKRITFNLCKRQQQQQQVAQDSKGQMKTI
ncbi:Hypothetical predicted protein [Scomber scombrus]|uniref:Uncharacterized protein n=1 Tax=Scomber scombrus TaxID=13677 RepID=A0AAV1NJK4_SCOSC